MTTILASGILRAAIVIGALFLGWYLRDRACSCGAGPSPSQPEA